VTKRTLDLAYAAAWLAGAAALLWASFGLQFENTPISRNPAWFPQLLLTLMLIAAAVLAVRSFIRTTATPITSMRWQALAVTLLISALYLAAFVSVGFIPATVVLIPLMSWLLGFRRPLVIVLVTAGMTIGLWYAFTLLLNVTPPGPGLPVFR
jgi:putative tricarboxylic transport membrane protein